MPSIPQNNLLSEANPSSVQDLFNKNPTELTQSDIENLVQYYRKLREDIASSATVRHTRVRKEEMYTNMDNIDFSDL